ncbi:glutamate--cysteine ligase [Microbacterium sp. NPDC057407]|uniref:glutamate--cysteine ligase n=1 Tax=Microbacterium sp. NPDC057407 TaxID=3346120 RepID=UPI00367302CF
MTTDVIPSGFEGLSLVPARGRTPTRLVGIEEELLLFDAVTFEPVASADAIVGPTTSRVCTPSGTLLEREVKGEQIEVVSRPVLTFDQILQTVVDGRRAADAAAREVGARAVALATAPVLCETHLISDARYERMSERFGLTMVEQLTCGFHVHVDVRSRHEGVAILDRIRPWLPVLLAVSANSPFWRGVDSAFASYRYQAWGRWPSAGPYDPFGSVAAYDEMVAQMVATGVALDPGMIYFDARLSHHVPTVEIRIADVCLVPEDAAVLAALVRALVETAAQEWAAGVPFDDTPTTVLRLSSWLASRGGVTGELLHPVTLTPRPAVEAVAALLDHVKLGFASPAEAARVRAGVGDILRRGTGADLQRRAMAAAGSAEGVVRDAAARTVAPPFAA